MIIIVSKNDQASPDEVRAAQLYDFLQDEFRNFGPTPAQSELALCMLMGAFISGMNDNDRDAAAHIGRLGELIGVYYERTKKINKRRRDQERQIIKLDS